MGSSRPTGTARLCSPATLLCLLACTYGDLGLQGKLCDADNPCPGDLLCVEVPDSAGTRIGQCYTKTDAPACAPGERSCSDTAEWVEICDADGHSRSVHEVCTDDRECNPDTLSCAHACAEDSDCDQGETCDLGTLLCRPYSECRPQECQGLCVGDACVPRAAADASSPIGTPEMDCFLTPPDQPPDIPDQCEVTGRVNLFPSKDNSHLAVGLQILLLDASFPYTVLQTTEIYAGADDAGYYTFPDVETNRAYLVEIPAGVSDAGEQVVTTLNGGLHLRADLCVGGVATRGLSAMSASNYETFTSETIDGLDEKRGLLIGRALDCNADSRRPLGNVTVGLAIDPAPPGRVYYFADESYLFPDLSLTATTNKGYYAAAGLPACRNQVGFAARQGASDLMLGSVGFFLRPGTVVIADLPLPDEQLTE